MFDKDYFINSEISNYQDYTKKKYGDLCEELICLYGIEKSDSIIDWWCATGNLIIEFVDRWYTNIKWSDISVWAVDYARSHWLEKYVEHYNENILSEWQYVIMNDVLEHMNWEKEIGQILSKCKWKIILRVPVCAKEWEDYVLECSRADKTHLIRWTKKQRENVFNAYWYKVERINGKHIFDSDWVLAVILTKND